MAKLTTNLTDACSGCPGRCCTRRFWGGVYLTKSESRDPKFKGLLGLNSNGDPMLMLGKTACPFLERKTGRCSIYEQRPMACRGYVCHTGDGYSAKVIHSFPALRAHLKRQGVLPDLPPEESFFYLKVPGSESVWHLRELRGTKKEDVWRYDHRRYTHEMIGWFDRRGKFHRTHR